MSESLIYGIHPAITTLNNPRRKIHQIWLSSPKKFPDILEIAKTRHIPVKTVTNEMLNQKTNQRPHQGVLLFVAPLIEATEKDLFNLIESHANPLLLILDSITDPHNLGACLRTAEASGVNMVVIPKDKSANTQSAIVHKVACGAVDHLPCVSVTNLARTMKELKQAGVWLYGAAGNASQTLWSTNFSGPCAIVMGSEGSGLRRLTREHCDELFSIPMHGVVESLNVSVATGVCLYEALRQRKPD